MYYITPYLYENTAVLPATQSVAVRLTALHARTDTCLIYEVVMPVKLKFGRIAVYFIFGVLSVT